MCFSEPILLLDTSGAQPLLPLNLFSNSAGILKPIMGKADLHIHTKYSKDGTASIRETLESAVRAGLDVIAITDHDEVRGALEARAIFNEYGIHVIPGAEVSTSEGHLIVLFIDRNIPVGMSLIDTLICVREMGGMAIVAHPDQPSPTSISMQSILKALEHQEAREVLHGIEVCNMNPTHSPFNGRSQKAADKLPLAQIASSDAHIVSMIGAGSRTLKAPPHGNCVRQSNAAARSPNRSTTSVPCSSSSAGSNCISGGKCPKLLAHRKQRGPSRPIPLINIRSAGKIIPADFVLC